jgi:hypothetical protein
MVAALPGGHTYTNELFPFREFELETTRDTPTVSREGSFETKSINIALSALVLLSRIP